MDGAGEDYATFESYEDAKEFICARRSSESNADRRWQVVDSCSEAQPPA